MEPVKKKGTFNNNTMKVGTPMQIFTAGVLWVINEFFHELSPDDYLILGSFLGVTFLWIGRQVKFGLDVWREKETF
jgi:hypothetical protein